MEQPQPSTQPVTPPPPPPADPPRHRDDVEEVLRWLRLLGGRGNRRGARR